MSIVWLLLTCFSLMCTAEHNTIQNIAPITPPICGVNEELSTCKIVCPPQTCESIYTLYLCSQNITCELGCNCLKGYLRNSNGVCVPSNECSRSFKCGYNERQVKCRTICPPQVCENSYTEYACGEPVCEPGCDCLPNYLRNSSGICIPNETCPPPPVIIPTCGLNEELSTCKIICPPQTCESIYTLYLCSQNITCELGCNCLKGYLRNSSGVCVPSEQCPTTPPLVCEANEVASDCKITCPPQTCDSIFTTYNCDNVTICAPGCNCIDGFLRNEQGICTDKCFSEPTCDIPVECRSTCSNPNPPNCKTVSVPKDNEDSCKCKPGYILSDANGKCIQISECPADGGCNGDPNSIVTSCPWPCPSSCNSPNAGTCGKKCVAVGCQCKPGFILSDDKKKCIRPDQCKSGNPCGVNGTYSECAFRCPNQNCPEDDSLLVIACKPGRPCPPGCLCKEYYRRQQNSDKCVLASDCPPVECTRPNEVFNPCASECLAEDCSNVDQKPVTEVCVADPNNCQPKCVCADGYFRNANSECVPKKDCPRKCSVSPECRPTCAVPNPPGCSFVKPSDTNEDGCKCQQDYILSDVNGKCIKIEDCPANNGCNGDRNATVKQCPLPCPSTCNAPNATPCKKQCVPVGCECNPGYLLSDINGKCISADDCTGGNPCGPNASFGCQNRGCPSSYCPTDDSRARVICEFFPFSPCLPGCFCKLNNRYLSREDPRCILSEECPPVNCTRPNEIWNPCPLDCSSGYCEDVDKPKVTCNILVRNCNPQCVCKKNFYRNPKTDICVSSAKCRKINASKQQKN